MPKKPTPAPTIPDDSCATCQFYLAEPRALTQGVCRRYPPQQMMLPAPPELMQMLPKDSPLRLFLVHVIPR